MTVSRPCGSLVLVMQALGLYRARYRNSVLFGTVLPSTRTVSALRSAFDPSSLTTTPLTLTRPACISSSALRREVIPARAMIFWSRSGMNGVRADPRADCWAFAR